MARRWIISKGHSCQPGWFFVYVTNNSGSSVSVIDIATNTVKATIPVGSGPDGVALTPDCGTAYVINEGSNSASVIDTQTNTVKATIAAGSFPDSVTFSPNGERPYVTNSGPNTVSVINTETRTVKQTVSTSTAAWPSPDPAGVTVTRKVRRSEDD